MTFKASAHRLRLNQLDDWIKLIRRRCLRAKGVGSHPRNHLLGLFTRRL